jgi:SAM-dependent methyltransferase
MIIKIQFLIAAFLRTKGKHAFILSIPNNSAILDVGCGNNSPYKVKTVLPFSNYTGVDIGDHNQSKINLADAYILTEPENFAKTICDFGQKFDAVICSHNLEHCNDRDATLVAMLNSIRKGGRLYLSFPCESSIKYPKRSGTLNYFDDKTHVDHPPDFDKIKDTLNAYGYKLVVEVQNYRPILLRTLGWMSEPFSMVRKKVLRGTWEFYGFESIIWAEKN